LEQSSPLKAETAYRNAIAADAELEDAHLNLGALLCHVGRCSEAIGVYENALKHGHQSPALLFNLALAQEDAGCLTEAMLSLRRCIRDEPTFRDAYFNLARLEEQLGDTQAALRHLNDYRRLGAFPG
jgi:tetratricopeptide (TPR) repeat protein